jgi:putative ABC transport system ATP-binding protein
MGLLQSLNEEGVTIIMVTHEPDVALHAKRRIVLRDGAIVSDEPIQDRTVARR